MHLVWRMPLRPVWLYEWYLGLLQLDKIINWFLVTYDVGPYIWVWNVSGSGSPHVAFSNASRLMRFFILIWIEHKSMPRRFFGKMSPWCLFWHCQPYIAEYKTWLKSCSDWQCFCCSVFWWCHGRVQKKLPMKLQRKAIFDNFCRVSQYERLEGQEGQRFSATKMNFEKLPARGGPCVWIQNSLELAHICFYFWPRNQEKAEN